MASINEILFVLTLFPEIHIVNGLKMWNAANSVGFRSENRNFKDQ